MRDNTNNEYDLFQVAVPHHEAFQNSLSKAVAGYATSSSNSCIDVLEIGVGTGITTKRLLETDQRVHITGIDIDAAQVKEARANLHEERVTLVVGDAIEVLRNHTDNSMDVIASAYTIHNLIPEQREQLIRECARVLKPGGLFVNADKVASSDTNRHFGDLTEQVLAFDIFDKTRNPALRKEWLRHYIEDDANRFSESDQISLLRKYNFVDIKRTFRKSLEATFVAVKSGAG